MTIIGMNSQNQHYVNTMDESHDIIGKIVPEFDGEHWRYHEVLTKEKTVKNYPNEANNWAEYRDDPDKAIYFAVVGEQAVGQIILEKAWNLYAHIEDISVARHSRGIGIGTALMHQAEKWGKKRGLKGLSLETQDTNVLACRFYQKCGMNIGGVNTMYYANLDQPFCDEAAVFWYRRF